MLELIDVKKYYKNNRAVDGISFMLNDGEALGLIGANGAGKSTTISMIATILKPDSGRILLDGYDIVENPKIMRKKLGYVPQEIALYPSLSGKDNLLFWGRANHIRETNRKNRIDEICDIIGFNEEILNKKVSSYSGGMKRRLNIGVALLHKPKLVVLDEPTVGLDVESRDMILEAVIKLKQQGTSIIYTGHYIEEIEQICDKICMIHYGKSVVFGDKEELLKGEHSLVQLYLDIVKNRANSEC